MTIVGMTTGCKDSPERAAFRLGYARGVAEACVALALLMVALAAFGLA
jgi:hypothetical protein